MFDLLVPDWLVLDLRLRDRVSPDLLADAWPLCFCLLLPALSVAAPEEPFAFLPSAWERLHEPSRVTLLPSLALVLLPVRVREPPLGPVVVAVPVEDREPSSFFVAVLLQSVVQVLP